MTPTETIKLRTDTVEQLVELLESDLFTSEHPHPMPKDRREVLADQLRGQIDRPDAIALCGLPGAGKTHVAEKLGEVYDAPVVSMGDAIRREFCRRTYGDERHAELESTNLDSSGLSKFAASWRDEAPEEIPEKVADIAENYFYGTGRHAPKQSDLIIIDGVRSPTDYEVLTDYFDEFYLLEVTAPFYTRLGRLNDRGREGEDEFDAVDLAERDERERTDLGYDDLIDSERRSIQLTNEGGEGLLRAQLSNIVQNNLPFGVDDAQEILSPVGSSSSDSDHPLPGHGLRTE